MRALISAVGNHLPHGQHYMVVDGHGVLLDLSAVHGTLHGPTIHCTEWGLQRDGTRMRHGGVIVRQNGQRQPFWDATLLAPYLLAFFNRRDAIAAEQAKHIEAGAKTLMIVPTVGRIVWYRAKLLDNSHPKESPEQAAIVVRVHSDRMVNLVVFGHGGDIMPVTSVHLVQDGDDLPFDRSYAEWMPFQKGQAAKAEALEAKQGP